MTDSAVSRRAFLGGLAATGAAGWLYDSNAFSARVIRGAFADARREVVRLTPPSLSSWSSQSVDVLWAGHATALVNFFGLNILTDPVFFDWIGAQIGIATIGRRRLVGCALDPENLPRVDLVLLSHAHMDHLDMPSLQRLDRGVPVITAPQTTDLLAALGFHNVRELRWDQRETVRTPSGELLVRAVEVKHWGARWRTDSHRGYVGYLLERGGKRVLFGGDTAYTEAFRALKGSAIDVAIMPIGSYGSRSGNHCTPEETVRMANECGAEWIVPVHHSTFPIGKEPLAEPLERLHAALSPDRLALQSPGGLWTLPG